MARFSLFALAALVAPVHGAFIVFETDSPNEDPYDARDLFLEAAATYDIPICLEDFEDGRMTQGLTWTSTTFGNDRDINPGTARTGMITLPYTGFRGNPPVPVSESSNFIPDGTGVFIDKFLNEDTGVTTFTVPAGTSAWGAVFDMPFISNGAGIRVQVIAGGVPVGELDGGFMGFWGVVFDDGFKFFDIEIRLLNFADQTETYILDDMYYESTISGCFGEPHFIRWTKEERDSFQGECDIVLLHQDNVEEGIDLDVHVRTTIRESYSFIEQAALKIGNDVVEFHNEAVFLNGVQQTDIDFPLEFGNNNKVVEVPSSMLPAGRRIFNLQAGKRIAVEISSTKKFMGVKISGHKDYLGGSVGMLGDYHTGDMIARDGRLMTDYDEYGFEWQVAPTDPKLFMADREPQLPYERCRMPQISAATSRRRLRGQENRKLYDQAVEACLKNQIPANMQSCVDDVMFTGELDLAEAF